MDIQSIIQIIFAIVNIFSLILLGVGYFRSRFTIVDLETYNAMVEIVEEYTQMKEKAESSDGGGTGFFWDYISDLDEEQEEEENG